MKRYSKQATLHQFRLYLLIDPRNESLQVLDVPQSDFQRFRVERQMEGALCDDGETSENAISISSKRQGKEGFYVG